jgi:O-antigen ligase
MIKKNLLIYSLGSIVTAELISFLTFVFPVLEIPAFALVSLVFLIACLKDLRFGIFAILTELVIGSKGGYLFFLNIGGTPLSIRMTFWLILLSVWAARFLIPTLLRKKQFRLFPFAYPWIKQVGILFILILWGLLNAFSGDNSLSDIFFDFNGYLYFILIFPFFASLVGRSQTENDDFILELLQVFGVATVWISVKTMALLFLFAHRLESINKILYSWVRSSGVGEITQMEGGFYRIFFQSHIYVLVLLAALFLVLIHWLLVNRHTIKILIRDRLFLLLTVTLILLASTSIVSMSRSNWVGIIVIGVSALAFIFIRHRSRGLRLALLSAVLLFVSSYLLVLITVQFPYPKPIGGFAASDILSERASDISGEAGVSSRWNLLPVLWEKINQAPLAGSGFGSTVTYISNDPRVRNASLDGSYTTFAFEWGWLDIWIKLGFFGFLAYCLLFLKLIKLLFSKARGQENELIYISTILALLALSSINFFSPYLNHPLGIGLLLFIMLITSGFSGDIPSKDLSR